jgi:hypothetical protein
MTHDPHREPVQSLDANWFIDTGIVSYEEGVGTDSNAVEVSAFSQASACASFAVVAEVRALRTAIEKLAASIEAGVK